MKKCPKCGKKHSAIVKYFYKSIHTKSGLDGWCKICRKKYARKHNKNLDVKKRKREYDKKRRTIVRPHLKECYNITLSDYNKIFIYQKECCIICGIHQSKLKNRLCVDHNHQTGKIRGLLCHQCNLTIGHIEVAKKKGILQKTIEYLSR